MTDLPVRVYSPEPLLGHPAKLVGTNELLVIPPQGAARHIYVRSENGRAAYLYAGSRAYARQ